MTTQQDRRFRDALGQFATGVCVVIAKTPPLGMTVNSFNALSLQPPLVIWCLADTSENYSIFSNASRFTINILSRAQEDLSSRLSKVGCHSLEGIPLARSRAGELVIQGALAWFDCSVYAQHEGGDHKIMVSRVEEFYSKEEGEPLIFHRGVYRSLG